jgi:superfamily I DNA and RNA helicase
MELPPNSFVRLTLDIEQERIARRMGSGHRLISGVAGSGKTLILLTRAKILANRFAEHRILILCFNITLAAYLRSLLHDDSQNSQYKERIEVMHFNAWAKSLLGSLPNPNRFTCNDGSYDKFLGEEVIAALQQLPLEQKWDCILVDEAHTFYPNWFSSCVQALKDPENGDLLIVSDRSQSLYSRPDFTWSSVGVRARGRSTLLHRNYRNTQEILTAAWSVVKPLLSAIANDDNGTFPLIEPRAAFLHGPKPVLHLTESKAKAVTALIHQIKDLAEAGYALEEIAVLYRRYRENSKDLFDEMLEQLNQSGLKTYWVTEDEDSRLTYCSTIPGIRVITSLSSLELEFKAVLLLWIEQLSDCCNSNTEEASLARRQLYVAMTRAQDELHLFGSGSTRILEELQQSQSCEIVNESEIIQSLSALLKAE